MNDIEFKAFVIPFYRSLLGFWVLALVFGGVFMELKQHILLGKFLFEHPLAFSILPFGFLLYAGFHLRFQLLILRTREYRFFHHTALLPFRIFGKSWTVILLSNHLILIGYLAFLSYFGLEKNAWTLLATLWLVVLFALGISIWLIRRHLCKPLKEAVLIRPRWKGALPRITWFALELRQNRPILLLLTKGLSLLLLNGFFLSFRSGSYDHRWLEFGVLCVAFFQIPILMEKSEFENSRMEWFRNLPRPFTQKMLTHLGTLVLVLFPELLFLLLKGGQQSGLDMLISLPLFLISLVLALQGLVYRFPGNSFFQFGVGLFFGSFLLILFGVPWIFPVLGSLLFFASQIRSPFQL
ncbi:hypothetical protein [Algoriphagus terrigena]|uniref:hypothetical protein n=1 Tax=Algoriphagus terrigena TaxID=344884 RepID=UPI000413EC68|nr:hypothetical protein [Algoriphagus terrigena]